MGSDEDDKQDVHREDLAGLATLGEYCQSF